MDVPDMTDRKYYLLLVAILLVAVALRVPSLGVATLSSDEMISVFDVRGLPYYSRPLPDQYKTRDGRRPTNRYGLEHDRLYARDPIGLARVYRAVRFSESTPVLFFFALAPWSRAFGIGAAELRLLPVLFGVLSILAAGVTAAFLGGRRIGLYAAAFLTVLPIHINYSRNLRAYSLSMLWASLATYFAARLLAEPRWKWTGLLGVCYALGMYTHYWFFMVIVGHLAFVLARHRQGPVLKHVMAALVIAVILFAPWIPFLRAQTPASTTMAAVSSGMAGLAKQVGWVLTSCWLGKYIFVPRPVAIAIALAAWAVVFCFLASSGKRSREAQFAAWNGVAPLIVPVAVFLLMMKSGLWAAVRFWVVLVPGLALAFVWGVATMRKWISVPLCVVLGLAVVVDLAGYYQHPGDYQFAKAVQFVRSHTSRQAFLITEGAPSQVSYYTPGYPHREFIYKWRYDMLEGHNEVCLISWDLPTGVSPAITQARKAMSSQFRKVAQARLQGVTVQVYRRQR